MSRPGAARWSSGLIVAVCLVAWSAASGASAGGSDPSTPAGAATIASHPTVFDTAADVPAATLYPKPVGTAHGIWVTPAIGIRVDTTTWVPREPYPSPSILVAGPVARGLAGRGPPPFGSV